MSKEEKAYDAIIGDLYQGTFDEQSWDRGLTGLARLVGGEGPLLVSLNRTTNTVSRNVLYSYDSTAFMDYSTYWAEHDPRISLAGRTRELDVLTQMALLDRKTWENTAIYNEYLKPNDAPYSLPCTLHNDSTKFTFIAIQATNERGPFDQNDGMKIRPLMQYVRRALEIKDRLEQRALCADSLRSVVDALSFGVIVLDEQCRIIEASSAALATLQTVCPTAPCSGQPLQLPEPAQRELSLLLASSFTKGNLSDGLIHIVRDNAHMPLSILIAPAPVILQSWILSTPRWLLFVFDPEQCLIPASLLLEKDLHLSAREAEVAALLAAGLAVPQIASRLNISIHTLRTQLKACFDKTACRSQSDLVRAIMNSAAWARTSKFSN